MRALLVGLVLALAGCESAPVRIAPPQPLANVCSSLCTTPCATTAEPESMPRWVCADPEAGECWDAQREQVTEPLIELIERCDTKRAACVQCIERSDNANATCGTVKNCGEE